MSKRTYMIAFDPLSPTLDVERVNDYVKHTSDFAAWWNHVHYLYLVVSDLNADEIADRLKSHTNGSSFLVIQVDPGDSEGLLPKQAWNWIRSHEEELQADAATPRAFETQA
jgi:hypothetical protein